MFPFNVIVRKAAVSQRHQYKSLRPNLQLSSVSLIVELSLIYTCLICLILIHSCLFKPFTASHSWPKHWYHYWCLPMLCLTLLFSLLRFLVSVLSCIIIIIIIIIINKLSCTFFTSAFGSMLHPDTQSWHTNTSYEHIAFSHTFVVQT